MFSKLSTRAKRIIIIVSTGIVLSCLCLVILISLPDSDESVTPTAVAQLSATVEETTKPAATSSPIPTETATIEPTATSNFTFAGMVFGRPAGYDPYPAPGSAENRVPAQVVSVIDGDTIEVLINDQTYRLRYIGIDTPESGAPLSDEATQANRNLVDGKTVYLESDVSNTDQYDRLLRYVYLADGTFVNAELVRLGFAESKAYPPDTKYQSVFDEMQSEAKANELGLWVVAVVPTLDPPTEIPPTEKPPEPKIADVQIVRIFYDGVVARVESDEYAEIKNLGDAAVNLRGWRLNAGNDDQDYRFGDFELQPGQTCRVYTDEIHNEYCGFSFGSGQALWNNKEDCGYLYSDNGELMSSYCY